MNLNPYDIDKCKEIVTNNFESKIINKFSAYNDLSFNKWYTRIGNPQVTSRQNIITGTIQLCSFYYIQYLLDKNPSNIIDLGCGMNFFKDILPSVTGIDGREGGPDIYDIFDERFIICHEGEFESIITINALHFISIATFRDRIIDLAKVLKDGGRAYVAMNSKILLKKSSHNDLMCIFGTIEPTQQQVTNFIHEEIQKLPFNLLVVDVLIEDCESEYIDGNIRIVLEK